MRGSPARKRTYPAASTDPIKRYTLHGTARNSHDRSVIWYIDQEDISMNGWRMASHLGVL